MVSGHAAEFIQGQFGGEAYVRYLSTILPAKVVMNPRLCIPHRTWVRKAAEAVVPKGLNH